MAKQQAPAPTNDFEKYLKKSGAAWDTAREKAVASAGGGFGEYDDGKYMARLQKMEGGVNDNGAYIRVQYKFIDGDYEGKVHSMFQNMRTDENLYHAARLLAQFGYELPDKLTDIPAIMAEISKEKPLCRITIKTRGEYQNTYLDKVIDETEADDDEDEDVEDEELDEEEGDEEEDEDAEGDGDDEEDEDDDGDDGDDDGDDEVDGDEEGDLEVGMRVEVETSKGTRQGVVTAIDEAEGTVKVKADDGKVVKVTADKVSIITEAPEEPPAKPAKSKAAAAATPAPKTTTKAAPAAKKKSR